MCIYGTVRLYATIVSPGAISPWESVGIPTSSQHNNQEHGEVLTLLGYVVLLLCYLPSRPQDINPRSDSVWISHAHGASWCRGATGAAAVERARQGNSS